MINPKDKYRIIFKIDNPMFGVSLIEAGLVGGYGELNFIYIQDGRLETFLSETELQRAAEIGYQRAVKRDQTLKMFAEIEEVLKEIRSFFGELDLIDIQSLPRQELKELFVKYCSHTDKLYRYFSYGEFYYFSKIEDELRNFV